MNALQRAAIAGLWVSAGLAHGAPGDLDVTFAGTGTSRVGWGGATDAGQALAMQPDGRFVVAGSTQHLEGGIELPALAVARYLPDGSLDPSFDGDGKVVTQIDLAAIGMAVKIQSDGKIVVAGQNFTSTTTSEVVVTRYNTDGALDPLFSGDGIVVTNFGGPGLRRGESVLIQPDGRIIVAGAGLVLRYLNDGTPDPSFGGGDGAASALANAGRGAFLQSDGKILLTGGSCGGSLITTCSVAVVRLNADGTPDTAFDGDGLVVTSLPSLSEFGNAVAVQPGGVAVNPPKIVVVGKTVGGTVILRYNLDGSPDTTFDGDGILMGSFGVGNHEANAVGFQTNGQTGATRIVIAGSVETISGFDFAVTRLLLNGALDSAFDGDGIAFTPVSAGADHGAGMVVADGRITVAGSADGDFAVVRYNQADGSLDTSFDGDGKKVDNIGDVLSTARGIALQPDGKIVVAGDTIEFVNTFAVLRYNVDGSLDTSFGGNGKVRAPLNGTARAVAIQSNGRIVVAGSVGTGASSDFALARYLSDGSLDPSLNGDGNSDGTITMPIGPGEDVAHAVALQSDGKIVLAGTAHNGSNLDFAVARYNANGSPDLTFDGDGKAITPIGAGNEEGRGVTIQADGKVIVAGLSSGGANDDFAVVRYKSDGLLDFSFSFDAKVTTPILGGHDGARAVAMDGDKIVVAGFASNGANNDFAVARYNADGSPDNLFDLDGRLTTEIGADDLGAAVIIQPGGRILVAGVSFTGVSNDFALVRYDSNGALDATYGTGGRVVVNFSEESADSGYALALDSIGRAVVAGEADGHFAAARLLGDPLVAFRSRPTGRPGELEGLGVPGLANTLLVSPNLGGGSFGFLATVTPDENGFWEYSDPGAVGVSRRFYRLTFP